MSPSRELESRPGTDPDPANDFRVKQALLELEMEAQTKWTLVGHIYKLAH